MTPLRPDLTGTTLGVNNKINMKLIIPNEAIIRTLIINSEVV